MGFISTLAPLLNYLRRRSPGPPFPPDSRQAGERGATNKGIRSYKAKTSHSPIHRRSYAYRRRALWPPNAQGHAPRATQHAEAVLCFSLAQNNSGARAGFYDTMYRAAATTPSAMCAAVCFTGSAGVPLLGTGHALRMDGWMGDEDARARDPETGLCAPWYKSAARQCSPEHTGGRAPLTLPKKAVRRTKDQPTLTG